MMVSFFPNQTNGWYIGDRGMPWHIWTRQLISDYVRNSHEWSSYQVVVTQQVFNHSGLELYSSDADISRYGHYVTVSLTIGHFYKKELQYTKDDLIFNNESSLEEFLFKLKDDLDTRMTRAKAANAVMERLKRICSQYKELESFAKSLSSDAEIFLSDDVTSFYIAVFVRGRKVFTFEGDISSEEKKSQLGKHLQFQVAKFARVYTESYRCLVPFNEKD